MQRPNIVLIGAASGSFGPRMVADAVLTPEIHGGKLTLVDLDESKLAVVRDVADRLNAAFDARLTVETTTDRRAALPGADFVIVSVAIRRFELWKQEFEIPLRHGLRQVLGENGAPAASSTRCATSPTSWRSAATSRSSRPTRSSSTSPIRSVGSAWRSAARRSCVSSASAMGLAWEATTSLG